MKGLITEPGKPQSVKLKKIDNPIRKKGEVLLKILNVGIDGTDREINEGIYGAPPKNFNYLVLGHETLARIQELDEEQTNFGINDLVVPTVRRSCIENCINCNIGQTDMCLTGNYFEHGIFKLHGFGSDYAISNDNFIVKIPKELKEVAVLLEPLSVVEKAVSQLFNIQKRLKWKPKNALITGAGPLGLLASLILSLKGLNVYVAATRDKESLKAKIVREINGKYINVKEEPLKNIKEKFDLIIEATGAVDVVLETLNLININGPICLLGIYRKKETCKEFSQILTNTVLRNNLIFGSVSSNKKHFEMGINDMRKIKKTYGNILKKFITSKIRPEDFKIAFKPSRENIKTIINFNN